MIVSMGIYIVGWQYANKKGQKKEAERIEALRATGWLKEKQDEVDEKREDGSEIPIGIDTM